MRADLLHLVRSLRRSPASAVAAVLTLTLTLGANASIFAIVDAVVLTPPPFANPESLVVGGEIPIDGRGTTSRAIGYATYDAWRERAGPLASLEAFDGTNLTLTGTGAAERVSANDVTPGFLKLLGVTPSLGRGFEADDVAQPIVIVSHAFWRGALGGDPNVIGHRVTLGAVPHTIVGVLPERFVFALNAGDFWRPLPIAPAQAARTGYRVAVVGRLAPGASASLLTAALDEVNGRSSPPMRAVVTPIATRIAGDATRILGLLTGAATLALLVAFTNLAGLLVVRAIDRRRELAVRSALGARRSQIVRQLVLEAGALVTLGICGGVLLAAWSTPPAARLVLAQFSDLNRDIAVNWRTIAGVSIVALACASVCGTLPALMATRRRLVDDLHRGTTAAPRELKARRALVTGEVALAFVLMVAMTLLGRNLLAVLDANPGFDARGVLTMHVAVPAADYASAERIVAFYSALDRALEERLGPRTASIVDEIPLTHDRGRTVVSARPGEAGREAVVRTASGSYFDVMRVPLVAGRSFARGDDASVPPRVVVSQSLADKLFASQPAVGRRIGLASIPQPAEIVGVVGDVKLRALDDPVTPTVYLSAWQSPSRSSQIVIRSTRPDADVVATVREEVARLDRDLPVYGIHPMREILDASPGVPARRVLTATLLAFAILAVVLGAIGLFGVVAHDVARRRSELALRLALGADPMRLVRATFALAASMVGAGLVAGGLLSIWTARVLGTVVVGIDRVDAVSVAVAAAVLLVAGAVAAMPAALRAARTDPLAALRAE